MGRHRINGEGEVVSARFPAGTLARIRNVLNDGEKQSEFLRSAVESALRERETRAVTDGASDLASK